MTVAELIAELQKMPQDATIATLAREYSGFLPATSAHQVVGRPRALYQGIGLHEEAKIGSAFVVIE